ncbi:hypothetical protein AcV5_007605 [Taiwanofungus camphoratus]|nr:hypothetical protein AcV5_007605 [Antrodia cinnamomea]
MLVKSPFPPVPPQPDQNVFDLLFNQPERAPKTDYTLHIDAITGSRRSRNEFLDRVRDGATALSLLLSAGGLGLGAKNEIVGILSHNCLDYIVLVHSLLYITTPFALISAFATPFELAHAFRTSKITRIFVQPALLPGALQVAREVGLTRDCIYIMGGRVNGKKGLGELIDDTRKRRSPRVSVKPAKRDTLAYLVFSSGTTGLPKAVMITHGNVCFSLLQNSIVGAADGRPPPDTIPVALGFLPMYHSYGLHMICFRGFLLPYTLIIVPKWNMDLVLKAIPRFRVNLLYMIPSAIHQLVNSKKIRPADFASVTSISCGAAYLPPQLVEGFKRAVKSAIEVTEGYGMSEVTITATRQPSPFMFGGRLPPVLGSVGLLLPGMEARIVRDDGSEADVNEPGELWVRGGNVAAGYWGNEKATKEVFVDGGWLRTGDQFRVDEKGMFYFLDRKKDTLKVSGVQVSPTEIEDLLLSHPAKSIVDVCVGGVSGGRTSDEKVPRAWIVLSEEGRRRGNQAVFEELEAWARKNLSKYKWLRGGIEAVDEIPKSPTGKTLRRLLQDRYEESHKLQAKL